MMLSDVRDYIESLGIAEPDHVYMGKLDGKQDKSIGVYNSKHEHAYRFTLGGPSCASYGLKYVTLLIHWNKSPRDTEAAATGLFDAIAKVREITVNGSRIKFLQPLTDGPVDVGTDDAGVYEMVIDAAVVYKKGEQNA